jgi:hypothetical protein
MNAIYQYAIDGNDISSMFSTVSIANCRATCAAGSGDFAADTNSAYQICKTTAAGTCLAGRALATTLANYLGSMPYDPSNDNTNGTNYYICKDSSSNTLTICASATETGYGASIYCVTR